MASTCGSVAASRRKSITGAKLVEGMMQQQVTGAQLFEHVQRLRWIGRQRRRERRVFQIAAARPVRRWPDRRLRFTGPETRYRSLPAQRELVQQEIGDLFRAVDRSLQPHGGAIAALRQLAFQRAAQIVHFLVIDEQVAVARDAEGVDAGALPCRGTAG